jgi:hypothetical protein
MASNPSLFNRRSDPIDAHGEYGEINFMQR